MARQTQLMAELMALENMKNVSGRVLTKLVSNSDKSARVLRHIQDTGLGMLIDCFYKHKNLYNLNIRIYAIILLRIYKHYNLYNLSIQIYAIILLH